MNLKEKKSYVSPLFEPRHEKTNFLHTRKKPRRTACGIRSADQCLCFHYMYSTISLFLKSKMLSLLSTSVAVLPSLLDLVGNPIDRLSHNAAHLLESCLFILLSYMSLVMTKPFFCICENKDADQLCGNGTADQRLCFCYTDTI